MLKFKLIRETEKELIYEYFPEGGSASGYAAYNKETGECNIIEQAENDKHNRYALKMLKRLREFASNKAFRTEGIVAWV